MDARPKLRLIETKALEMIRRLRQVRLDLHEDQEARRVPDLTEADTLIEDVDTFLRDSARELVAA